MRLLSRTAPPQYDEHLSYFTAAQANQFRRLVERSFAGAGRDVEVYADRVEDRSGTTFQLYNIGVLCVGADPADWSSLIEEHVRLVTTPGRSLADLTQDELESGLCLRLVDTLSVPEADAVAYARVLAPGLLEVLSVELTDSVATPSRAELEPRGTLGELLARGRDNLLALLGDDGLRAETVTDGARGRFTTVTGDSVFTASLALALEETIERLTGEDDWGRGALVAVPHRHQLMYRTIDTGDSAAALEQMMHAALRGFAREPGPLSPDVYWVRNRRWVQATSCASGKPRVLRSSGIRDALKGL